MSEEDNSDFAHDGRVEVRSSEIDDGLDVAVAVAVRDAQQLVDELAHDVRQPLSSVSLNVQSAIRCLQGPEPRVALALEALRECQVLESELMALVTAVQRRLSARLAESQWRPLDEQVLDDRENLIDAEWTGWQPRVPRPTEDAPYTRVAGALRTALAAIAKSILVLARTNAGASWRDLSRWRIETRRVSDRAQLRLSGIRCQSTDDIHFLTECVESAASHVQGKVSLELGPDASAIVISFPGRTATRRPTFARGHHGA